jgi:imidazolonepropionase-like amidohydrolase
MRLLALLLALLLQPQDPAAPKPFALRGVKVYPGVGAPIENCIIVVEKGRIAAIGRDAVIPADTVVVDFTGKVIIPGLIDAASRLFYMAGDRSPGSAEQKAIDALDFHATDVDEVREQGVTTVYVGPVSGGGVNGLGAVIHLDAGFTVLRKEAALKLTLGATGADSSTALERYQSYAQIRQALEAAKQYAETWDKYRRDLADFEQAKKDKKTDVKEPVKPKTDVRNEVIVRALDPKQPLTVRIEAHSADAITLALRLVEEFKLKAVLECATEGGAVAAAVAKAKLPAVVGPVFRSGLYTVEYLRHSPTTAAALIREGVPVAIGSFADERAGHAGPGASRFLMESAAVGCRGLTREQALATVTIEAARALGIDKDLGSLEKGKIADMVLLGGEPFETATRVERSWINGVPR